MATKEVVKKREVLPRLYSLIMSLQDMSKECAKLEIHDNEQARLRLKRAFIHFKNKEVKEFENYLKVLRQEVHLKPNPNINQKPKSDERQEL